ncbi:tripartite tricarboxylate transporter TctB family protein [Streptomonospora sp. PA3]|uniref:tripartite tricarboxylate transporter TctB family protein n=1 Tax=Streptomonospora sp. PA3 TaxID=2607326 RepID=UPI0012DD9BFD
MSSDLRRDLICAALILAVTAVFWTRQDFSTPTDVIFPRFVLVVLAVLGLAIAGMAVVRASRNGAASDGEAPEAGAGAELPPQTPGMRQAPGGRSAAPAAAAAPGTSGAGTSLTERAAAEDAASDDGKGGDEAGEEPVGGPRGSRPRWALPAAAALLLAWAAAFGLFGITLSGVVAFVATAILIRRGPGTPRRLLIDVGVALVVALFCWAVFTRVLYVPLPVSVLLGI